MRLERAFKVSVDLSFPKLELVKFGFWFAIGASAGFCAFIGAVRLVGELIAWAV